MVYEYTGYGVKLILILDAKLVVQAHLNRQGRTICSSHTLGTHLGTQVPQVVMERCGGQHLSPLLLLLLLLLFALALHACIWCTYVHM